MATSTTMFSTVQGLSFAVAAAIFIYAVIIYIKWIRR